MMSFIGGTFETCRQSPAMSAYRGTPEAVGMLPKRLRSTMH
jgi:hypothetical protein